MKNSESIQKFWVLVGEGIECEKETTRALEFLFPERNVHELSVATVLKNKSEWPEFSKQDWLFLPGGFSFSDHFGSGRLLAFELQRSGFFEKLLESGVHMIGVCNGFQVLTQSGLFGEGVSLKKNKNPESAQLFGFTNRWARLAARGPVLDSSQYELPVRHGEGRLEVSQAHLPSNTEVFLTYEDFKFQNGSFENAAGLVAKKEKSWIWGMMPHPEIALRACDHPDASGPESMPGVRKRKYWEPSGDGARLLKQIIETTERDS